MVASGLTESRAARADSKGAPNRESKILIAAAVIVVAATALARTPSTDQALDPVRVAPETHKIAFENAFVRVLDVRIPAGKIEPRHRHPHGLSVYFTDWEPKVTVDGRTPQVNQRKAGTFAWSDAVVHTVENVGKSEGHVLRIELKYESACSLLRGLHLGALVLSQSAEPGDFESVLFEHGRGTRGSASAVSSGEYEFVLR